MRWSFFSARVEQRSYASSYVASSPAHIRSTASGALVESFVSCARSNSSMTFQSAPTLTVEARSGRCWLFRRLPKRPPPRPPQPPLPRDACMGRPPLPRAAVCSFGSDLAPGPPLPPQPPLPPRPPRCQGFLKPMENREVLAFAVSTRWNDESSTASYLYWKSSFFSSPPSSLRRYFCLAAKCACADVEKSAARPRRSPLPKGAYGMSTN
mmetsp:Transcript_13634/g.45449  ORF Transcript_13634/g.45449 Transcript_13634/m.45449 type:complete len:210 (+) Transcript_13634:1103-1732(+)